MAAAHPRRSAAELLELHWQHACGPELPVYAVRDARGAIVTWACGRRGLNMMRAEAASEAGCTVERVRAPTRQLELL